MNRTDDRDAIDLMHLMGHLYLKSGQTQRGMVLLLIAVRMAPKHTGILRALCHGFLAEGNARRALNIIEHLEALGEADPTLSLLKSRAHLVSDDRDLARQSYREYITQKDTHDRQHESHSRSFLHHE